MNVEITISLKTTKGWKEGSWTLRHWVWNTCTKHLASIFYLVKEIPETEAEWAIGMHSTGASGPALWSCYTGTRPSPSA